MIKTPPFFSVVIPTYRRPEYLAEALASVLKQTFQDFEVIVVDDDTEEQGRAVVESFGDKRVSYVRNDRQRGGAGTRNAGIFRATGQWVAFLDDDDIWMPEKLAFQHEQIEASDSDLGLVYTGHTRFDPETNNTYTFVPAHQGWIEKDLFVKNVVNGFYSVAIRRDILNDIGGLDERFPAMQDLELYIRVAKNYKAAYLPQPLVRVRGSRTGRITTNHGSKLKASKLFTQKYKTEINRSLRFKHWAASQTFMYALVEGKLLDTLKSTPLTVAGIIADRSNIVYVARFVARTYLGRLRNLSR